MKKLFSIGIVLSTLILSMSSCKKATDDLPKNDISITNGIAGAYLTNANGQTLYMFANDVDGISSCTGGCESLWPSFTVDLATAKLDTSLKATDFATITRTNGSKQVTYKGWPLYTHSPSTSNSYGTTSNVAEAAGATGGDGFNGLWFIAKPDYTVMLANKQLTGLDGNNYKSDYTPGTGTTTYFTNGFGYTLYTFSADSSNINKFTKPDLSNYATFPFFQPDHITVPSILDKTLFGSISVFGRTQITYKGWPLYFFGQDNAIPGSTKAVSVPVPGKWQVAVKNITNAPR